MGIHISSSETVIFCFSKLKANRFYRFLLGYHTNPRRTKKMGPTFRLAPLIAEKSLLFIQLILKLFRYHPCNSRSLSLISTAIG